MGNLLSCLLLRRMWGGDEGHGEEARDWSSLTSDVLPLIARRLNTLSDYSSFRSVCPSWRAGVDPLPRDLDSLLPLLICIHVPTFTPRLFDVTHCRLYKICLSSEVNSRSVVSCSHEFIITATSAHQMITLHNIFTSTQILLPAPPKELISAPVDEPQPPRDLRCNMRVLLSSRSSERLAILFQPKGTIFGFCKFSGGGWGTHQFEADQTIDSMLFFKGTLFALVSGYRLVTLDLFPRPKVTFLGEGSVALPGLFEDDDITPYYKCLLAKSGDDLLLVFVSHHCLELLKVYRWNFEAGKWVEATSLGRRAVFISRKGFLASVVPSSDFWVTADCFYLVNFCLHCYELLPDGSCRILFRSHNLGLPDAFSLVPAVWLFPSMC